MHDHYDRFTALERRLRRTHFLAATSVAALLVFFCAAAMQKADEKLQVKDLKANSISTGSFTLRDSQGRPRISINLDKDGGPFVSLLDKNSKVRLLLTLLENEHPLVQISDADETPQINLFHNKNLGSGLTMQGTAGRALYAVPTGAAARIELSDTKGAKTFSAP